MKLEETKELAHKAVSVYSAVPNPLVAAVCTALVISSISVMAIRISILERNMAERTKDSERQTAIVEQHLDEHRRIVYRNHAILIQNSKLLGDEVLRQRNQLEELQAVLDQVAEKVGK